MDQNNDVIGHDMFTSPITANPSVILQKNVFGLRIDKLNIHERKMDYFCFAYNI